MPRPDLAEGRRTGVLTDLLLGATDHEAMVDNAGKSGAYIEWVTLDGQRYVLKYLDRNQDWTMRAGGVIGGATLELWDRGILARVPDCIEQPILAVATGVRPDDPDGRTVTAVLMRDVGESIVAADDEVIAMSTHRQFLAHMAALHAAFWEAGPEIDIVPVMTRYMELSPWTAMVEAELGSEHLVPKLVGQGWPLLEQVAPQAARIVLPLSMDPWPLVQALAMTPQTLVHGNFKLDNLGVTHDGRTVLLDWEGSGRGAGTSDLAWYLAINCRRLPESKEASIQAYREDLELLGIDTEPWWERQLALSLLGGLVQFGWEKAFGGLDDELNWWQEKAIAAESLL
ncbi:MAG: phosphotransferase [Actinomycetota bacterium]|nr:phosphotransferase [Actinomycetota bacterium]